MRAHLPLLLVLGLLYAACQSTSQPTEAEFQNRYSDPEMVRIADFQDRRNTDSLLPYLSHEQTAYRAAAAEALGSVQDSLALPALGELVKDSEPEVVAAAVYALGQLRDSVAAVPLVALLGQDLPGPVWQLLPEALGKGGTLADLERLLEQARRDAAFFRGLYQFGLRGIAPLEAQEAAVEALLTPDQPTVFFASAFLARLRAVDSTVVPQVQAVWDKVSDPESRSHLVRVFRHHPTPESQELLARVMATPAEDYRVRANAARSFSLENPHPELENAFANGLSAPETQVQVAAAERILEKPEVASLGFLQEQIQSASHWRARTLLYQAALQQALATSNPDLTGELSSEMMDRFRSSSSRYERGNLLNALGVNPDYLDSLANFVYNDEDPAIRSYAMLGIANLFSSPHAPKATKRFVILREAMMSGDEAVMAIAAVELRNPEGMFKGPEFNYEFLDTAWAMAVSMQNLETQIEIEKTQQFLADLPAQPAKEIPFSNPIEWSLVERIDHEATFTFVTNQGEIVLRLMVDEAPGTVANFVRLAEAGFFDGKTFHRVVPNFVAQGGCTRGDGWGSTPETIRSEWPTLHYQTGSVGVASAGKDTESCQFFITHSPTPHLDGRYTIFAQVIQGMDIAHRIEMGDFIQQVKLTGVKSNGQSDAGSL